MAKVTRFEGDTRITLLDPALHAAGDMRTPIGLLDEIEARGRDVEVAVMRLRALLLSDESEES
jgi:hypothetical protein